jgi:hypothetical protein
MSGFANAGDPWDERTPELGMAGKDVSGRLTGEQLQRLTDIGEKLFEAKFTALDGNGRPFATQAIVPTRRKHPTPEGEFSRTAGMDSNACSGCHNMPFPGGAGDFVTNVFVSEGFESADFDSIDPQFSNERGTNAINGDGLVELLAREITADLKTERADALKEAAETGKPVRVKMMSKGIDYGWLTVSPDGMVDMQELDGVDMDLVIRPFSQKGVMTSIRQFTVNALNQHHGMEAVERFGGRWTGTPDFDGDGKPDEMSDGDVSAIVAWQATLKMPTVMVPQDSKWKEAAAHGETLFGDMGCTSCHKPTLPLKSLAFEDPGPNDVSGTLNDTQVAEPAVYDLGLRDWTKLLKKNGKGEYLVPMFGDLKRHMITDEGQETLGNELMAQRFVDRNIFMTAELWGVGSTPPYGHRNDLTTLDQVIRAHGGEARGAAEKYEKAAATDRSAIIAFLKTLVIEQ